MTIDLRFLCVAGECVAEGTAILLADANYLIAYTPIITPRAHAQSVLSASLSVSVCVCVSSKFGADHDNEGSKRF